MRRVLFVSVGLHALALASVLLLRLPPAAEPDEPARIELVFGPGGIVPPAPSAPSAAAPAPQQPPEPAAGEPAGASAPASAAQAAPARPAAPDPGLLVEHPDARMIPAREADGNRGPGYPEEALRQGLHGTVLLRLHIGTDGAVTGVQTVQSSGFAVLDAAAAAALAHWHFLPARRDGQPVVTDWTQPVEFRAPRIAGPAW